MPRDVFISYRSEDKPAADRVCAALERENVRCWIAPRDIPIGQEWATAIVSALGDCSRFILILSSHSTTAKQISREAELADKRGLPIITVRIEDVQPPPELMYFLGNLQWLDAFGDNYESAMTRLAEVVRGNVKQIDAKAELPAATPPVKERITPAPGAAVAEAAIPIPAAPRASDNGRTPGAERSGLPSSVWAVVAAVLVIAIGLGIWLFTGKGSNAAKDASEFGMTYLRTRDSGDVDKAYAMLGPQMQTNWSLEKFEAAAAAMKARGKPERYSRTESCLVRERGAYACDFQLSYKDGRISNERLLIANPGGNWAIAGDRMPSASE